MKLNEVEQYATNLICEELEKADLKKYVKDDKEFEKRVRQIASDVLTDLFRVLWQHNSLFKNLSK